MDAAKRIELLRAQIDEANAGRPSDFKAWRERTRAALRVAVGENHPALERFDGIRYGLMMWSGSTPQSAWDGAQEAGVRSAIAILEGAIHELESVEPAGPPAGTDGLHPWVLAAIAGLWDDGHHRNAVDEAARAIELRLRKKIGGDGSGTDLVTRAFNPQPPTVQQPRLRFREYEAGTRSWTNAHQGAMHFGQGCMMRIRNLIEHSDDPISPQYARECLFALSLLARWIDEAEVERNADTG